MIPWHILGAGSIGGLWALRLHGAGLPVTLLGRHPDSRSLSLREGERLIHAQLSELGPVGTLPPIRRLLITTKAQDTQVALQPFLPALTADAEIVLLQNGMGVREELLELVPELAIYSGTTTDGVFREARNALVLAGRGETVIGALDAAQAPRCHELVQTLTGLGLPLGYAPDIKTRLWQKLAINCAINPLTVRFDCRNGELLQKPKALALMRAVCTELAGVMQAQGFADTAEALYQRACHVAQITAGNTSSMLADARAGRGTEIAYMNGFLVREAQQMRLPCAANQALLEAVAHHRIERS